MSRAYSFTAFLVMISVMISNPEWITKPMTVYMKFAVGKDEKSEDKIEKTAQSENEPKSADKDADSFEISDLYEPALYILIGITVLAILAAGYIALDRYLKRECARIEEERVKGLIETALENRLEHGELLRLKTDLERAGNSQKVRERIATVDVLLKQVRDQEEAKILREADMRLAQVKPKIFEEQVIVNQGRDEIGTTI